MFNKNKNWIEISNNQAISLIKEMNLVVGSTFSNNDASDLCSEYVMETGYWLSWGSDQLIRRITRKDDDGIRYTKNFILISPETFSVDEDDDFIALTKLTAIKDKLQELSVCIGTEIPMPEIISNLTVTDDK